MFARNTSTTTTTTMDRHGASLARGPAWITGLVLAIAGLLLFFRASGTPLSTDGFPDGLANGETFLGFEANAWTAWGTTAAGILVLIGAAQHALAKTMSLIAGLALGAAAIIALVDGEDVLGLAAANGWTALAWGVAAGILLVTALLPRLEKETKVVTEHGIDEPVTTPRNADTDESAPRTRTAEPSYATDPDADRAVPAGGSMRSESLRRTYEPGAQPDRDRDRDRELDETRRMQSEEAARRR